MHAWLKNSVTRMLTRDVCAVANFLVKILLYLKLKNTDVIVLVQLPRSFRVFESDSACLLVYRT